MKHFRIIKKLPGLLLMFFATNLALAQPLPNVDGGVGASGLKLPRFVSISATQANMRSGPGEQYPIQWVYKSKLYPLVVVGEFDQWRQVQDVDGTTGWMHRVLLSGTRTALITKDNSLLLTEPSAISPPVARLEAGVLGEIMECAPVWCRLDVDGTKGWIPKENLWGTFQAEVLN